jgi:hypothetical protein
MSSKDAIAPDPLTRAFDEARLAGARGEVPVGAVVARDGVVIAAAGNRTLADRDPTAHAEVLAIRAAWEWLLVQDHVALPASFAAQWVNAATDVAQLQAEQQLDWLLQLAETQADMLIGLDLSLGFPFIDQDAFFPEWEMSPTDARGLWALVETLSAGEPHLGANAFLAHPEAHRHFRHAKGDVGNLFLPGIGRLREVERHQRATRQANSWSCFNLVGAGQVGKSSLTGMRMIHQLQGRIPIWPFDPLPETGPVIVEIYTSMAARAAGLPANRSKVRDIETLAKALSALSAGLPQRLNRMDDHATDALITAAWMRCASVDPLLWSPPILDDQIRQTEGWTFGVV